MFRTLQGLVPRDRDLPERAWRLGVLQSVLRGTLYDALPFELAMLHFTYPTTGGSVPVSGTRALFGGPLMGAAPVYYIYVDEAGVSDREPVTVVVGIIVHADTAWRRVSDRVTEILDQFVPEKFRPDFVFHATDIWNGAGYRDDWPLDDRIALISAMVSVPKELGLAIAIGKIRRDSGFQIEGMKDWDARHVAAFGMCAARADKYIRDWAARDEVGTIVAENVSKNIEPFKKILNWHRQKEEEEVTPDRIRLTHEETVRGEVLQTDTGRISRIVDTVHFVGKREAPLLQIADACAFAFRRYFAAQDYGQFWVNAMLQEDLIWKDWQGPYSNMSFSFHPRRQKRRWRMGIPLRRIKLPWT